MLDHLVFATNDVDATAAWVAAETGIEPSLGGPHIGFGTRNTLCSLENLVFLEIVGPDAEQDEPNLPRPFGIDNIRQPTLVTWCARVTDLPSMMKRAALAKLGYSAPIAMSRQAPQGLIQWALSFPDFDTMGGIIPFVIDWGETPHPSKVAARGLTLPTFRAEHPDPDAVMRTLAALDLSLEVVEGPVATLIATIEGPLGSVELLG